MKRALKDLGLFPLLFFSLGPLFSQEVPPTPTQDPMAAGSSLKEGTDLSKPETPLEPSPALLAKPSPSEGERAPVPEKPSAVPEFSLPEVLITGRNESTIQAQRPDPKEENITMGSRELTAFDRSLDDLPGLSKTLTGLSTEDEGKGLDSSLILHYGGGHPGTHGGWGLMGHDFGGAQLLVSGNKSNWSGEEVPGGRTFDERWGSEGSLRLGLSKSVKLLLSGGYTWRTAGLPYQGGLKELRQEGGLSGSFQWMANELLQVQGKVSHGSTSLEVWDFGLVKGTYQEDEVVLKATADETGEFLNRVVLEAGYRRGDSDQPWEVRPSYDWGWLGGQALLKRGGDLSLLAKVQVQAGTGPELAPAVFPSLHLTWRVFETSQWTLSWGKDRYPEAFQGVFGKSLHISYRGGFPLPVENLGEWGTRFTQKIDEALVLSLSGSYGEWGNYHQWTDLDPFVPTRIQVYGTLPKVRLAKAGGNFQWNFEKSWQVSGSYLWAKGEDLSGGNLNFTQLPEHRGTLALYRGDDTWEARLELSGASERHRDEITTGLLPSYWTLGLDMTYRLTKTFSLWFNGDNLLGADQELQPGYPEPKFHLRAGVEVIF